MKDVVRRPVAALGTFVLASVVSAACPAADVPDMSAAEFGDFVGAEAKRIAAIMQAAGLKAQ